MKKKHHMTIAIAILACWLFLAFAFATGKLEQFRGIDSSSATEVSVKSNEGGEIPNPFTLRAVTTFLLQ